MLKLSQEEARKFIEEVREGNGGITVEDRDFLFANRRSALRALQSVRRQLADSIKILVDNLYSKETRFLYELIQNAEDNSYSIATADGEEPFLAFKLYPHKIIVDSNEDGFSESNIKAISSVANSTKKHSAGYIGEKGIGFKSVFKIAQKVHIQSGPFSFAFSHTREDDDDGLGMITPYYEDAEELPKGVRTRMTLTLLDSTKFEERAFEFQNVPDTFLMFLNRLQRLSIELYPPDNAPTVTQYSKRETKEDGLYTTFLAKNTRKGKKKSTSEQRYYSMKSDLHDLPFDEARKDKQGNSIDRATVILAFPVDEHDEPVLKQQYTYSFLPLRRVGFSFLIQADFITQASREDVVHSERNQVVLKGVAKAFVDAVVVLCKRPSLRYQWMKYLPGDFITDEFWGTLWTLVRKKLKHTPFLEPWSGNGLYKPSDLEKLSESDIAEDQSPLLPDLEGAEIYLSPKYTEADFQILRRLGTTTLQLSKFVDRLDADLRIPNGSKWRIMTKNVDWRTRICKLLSRTFIKNLPNIQERLRTLALIPLRDGRWVSSASATKVYFPKINDISIPADIGLDLVCPMAAKNVAWEGLLSNLGVMSCPQDSVVSLIHKRYKATNLDNFKVFNAVEHIRYLFWFLPKDHSSLTPQIRLANQHGSLLKKDQYLYFPDNEDNYSPSNLFKQDVQLPGYPVHYLHEDYLQAVDPGVTHNGRLWTRWLEEMLGVRRIPELRAKGHDGLSKEFQYIVNYRSNRLLGTLKRGWAHYSLQINNVVEEELRNSAVLLENGRKESLLNTFLPLPKLKQIAAELRIADAYPFIAISELLRDEGRLEWIFVEDLQVGIEENLNFYLAALETFKTINPALNTPARHQLARIYQNIQSKCGEGPDQVCEMFRHPIIWIQPSNRIDSTWLSTADCVWDGPQWLKSKQCLKLDGYLDLEHLFKMSLKIPDASQIDVINDLRMLKRHAVEKNASRRQSTAYIQSNVETAGTPYQVTSIKETFGGTENFQSITFMKAYEKESFEKLRLKDYDIGKKPLSTKTSVCKPKAFAGLETGNIMEEVEKRYDYLWQKDSLSMNGENPESQKALRSNFEDSALVYIPRENAWRSPSQCVWVESNIKIPWKVSIADTYPLKKTFFTTVLKISEPTIEMYIDSLKADAKGKASVAQIKETMALICGLDFGKTDLSSLIEAKVLPVKRANGVGRFASASSKKDFVDFAIVENTIHWDAFEGKIVVLDFSLEEIRDTRPLLLAMGLEERFSSKLVKEVTDVRGGFQDHEMTRKLRIKSQAIVRCAFHFTRLNKRQDVASLYRTLKRVKVYVSDGIRRSLQITQDGHSIEGASSRANFHLEEAEDALQLYLPKDEVEREICFESDLPRRLCAFLSITDSSAPGVIGGVFRKDNPAVIDKILENAGVGKVDCDFAALDEELGTSEAGSDVETLDAPSSAPRPYTPSDWSRRRERQSGSEKAEDVGDEIMPNPSYQERQTEIQETAYKRILEQVVNVARQRVISGVFESTGVSIRGPVATTALTQGAIREAFATRTQERDVKVGAAGELYMFEYLKGLGLPSFGLESWKSGIRDRVKIHNDYHDLEKDNDRSAIADIEYLDDSRRLTQFLIRRGHLAQRWGNGERPFYHIEIKTTTSSDWQEPFFMSKAQERHIQDKRIENDESRSDIYMICRIFNLGKGDQTGMHVYLDPETKRRNGELEFSTHTWAVKPLTYPTMPVGNFSNPFGVSPSSDTSKTSSLSLFGSNATSSNSDGSTNTPRGGVFGSSAMSATDHASKASSPGNIFGTTANSAASESTSPSTTGPSGFGASSSTTSEASFAKGLFETNSGTRSSNSFETPSATGLLGTKAVSSNSKDLESTSSTSSLGTAESLSSSTTGGLFGTNPTKIPETAASRISSAAVQPSSSSATDFVFGKAATGFGGFGTSSTTPQGGFGGFGASSTTPQGRFGGLWTSSTTPQGGFAGFGTFSTTPWGGFGINATTSASHDAFRSAKPISTTGTLFSASRKTSTSTVFGSRGSAETASTSKPSTSTAQSVLTSADSAETDRTSSDPFQAGYWLNKDNPFARLSPSPSPAPTLKSRSPQAREARSKASSKPAAGGTTAPAVETQPVVIRDAGSDEPETSDEQQQA